MHSPTRPTPDATDSDPDPDPAATQAEHQPVAAPDDGTPPVRRLAPASMAWRVALMLIGIALVIRGTVIGNDADWPFGPMSQFAFRAGPNDGIHSTFLEARNTRGEVFVVPLSPKQIGIGRAEVEGQMTRIRKDPSMLKDLADSYHRIHPNEPPLEQLWLRDRITELDRGRAVSEHIDPIVGWPDK